MSDNNVVVLQVRCPDNEIIDCFCPDASQSQPCQIIMCKSSRPTNIVQCNLIIELIFYVVVLHVRCPDNEIPDFFLF